MMVSVQYVWMFLILGTCLGLLLGILIFEIFLK